MELDIFAEFIFIMLEIIFFHTFPYDSEVAQSCPTLCDPVDCSPPGSSVHGSLQARMLEWVAISYNSRTIRIMTEVS